uniref:Uncharacterized protein n=1 Tax=Arundo donax TaxID=35708 RepID=A0A0A9FAZ1_ARUDO
MTHLPRAQGPFSSSSGQAKKD